MHNITKASHPVFIFSVLLLIVNDWCLKATFHNGFTGKLSDFAGLFAFAFFFSILFPKRIKAIHILTGVVFVFWKSYFSQPFIDWIYSMGIPMYRTIDLTDCIALSILPLSYHLSRKSFKADLRPFLHKTVLVLSCFAFIATTMPQREQRKYVDINKEYQFDFSRRKLISGLNQVQLNEINRYNHYGHLSFDKERDIFYLDYNTRKDTVALLLDYIKLKDQDTIVFRTSFAKIIIMGDDASSTMKLLTLYRAVPFGSDKDYREKAIKQFEKKIVKGIRKAVRE